MDNKSVFASNLQKYMKLNDKSRRDVCEDLGFSYYTFTDWVKGKKYPRMDKVEMLANYFGIQKSDLIEDKDQEEIKESAMFDGLSENQKKLMLFAQTVPEDKAALALRLIQSIVEAD